MRLAQLVVPLSPRLADDGVNHSQDNSSGQNERQRGNDQGTENDEGLFKPRGALPQASDGGLGIRGFDGQKDAVF